MKIYRTLFLVSAFLFVSCRSGERKDQQIILSADSSIQKAEIPLFFPVTEYLKGQVYEVKNGGVNPFKIVTTPKRTDSGWLKMEDLNREVSDFFSPEIDTANLVSFFSEKKFLDQTLNSITFTYDPIKPLPDTFTLQHWDVYVDPNTEKVTRIYLLKHLPQKKIQQLTWLSGKSCNIKTIAEDATGKPIIEKEMTIKWDPKE